MSVTFDHITQALKRIHEHIHITPIFTSQSLNAITGCKLYFKCENFQKIGAFKFRGACNAVFILSDEEAKHGVATHSSGNHGAALALAAKTRKIPAYIVMPENSAHVKKEAVAFYGADITFCESHIEARETALKKILEKTKAAFIHPYDNENIIAGQGTVAIEIIEQCPHVEMIIVPVGGGGLIAGIGTAVKSLAPQIKVIGAEPELANDAFLSFKQKTMVMNSAGPKTICDGLLTPIGHLTFPIILNSVYDIFTASEESILLAIKYIWERMKIIVEPSAAISLAIILENPEYFKDKQIALVLSGGNADIKTIANLL